MFWKLAGGCGLVMALAGCGGGSSPSSLELAHRQEGPAPTADSAYGKPQGSSQDQQAMARRLSAYFGREKATLTDAPPASQARAGRPPASAASSNTTSPQQKAASPGMRPHRFFNTATGVHFYTLSDSEKADIETFLPQFTYEGRAYRVLSVADFAVPVYRFYNRVAGTHLYTASHEEMSTVVRELSDLYNFEGIAWYARPEAYPGWVPVYRFFNRLSGTHFYTHDEAERAQVQARLPHYALEGVAYWVRSEDTSVDPATWQPPAGATPSTGNYVYFESQAGDFVGEGEQHLWTATDSRIQMINRYGTFLELLGEGYTQVGGYFFFPSSLRDWKTGFYPNATRENWMLNTAKAVPGPGLDFSMDGRGCNATTGWLYIDSVSHDPDGSLASFEVRFEQLCQWSSDVLRGKVRWSKYDTVMPPAPLSPPPSNLWRPATGAVPETGSFLYLEGNGVRNGLPHAYNRLIRGSDSLTGRLGFSGTGMAFGGSIADTTAGNESVWFSFQTPWFLPRLVPGQYREVSRTPMMNPARGNLDFYYSRYTVPTESSPYVSLSESWSCGGGQWTNGWFAVDEVGYVGDAIANIELRFERWCLGSPEVTRGMIRWQAGD